MAANNKLLRSSSTLALVIAALFTLCSLPPFCTAQSTSPALPASASSGAGIPSSGDEASAGPSATQPAGADTTALPPLAAATTASKKFPLPTASGGEYLPAAEVASALPVPTPDEFPSAASLGFGDHGDECCGGGGYGWFGGPGGFGPGTYGYNGPLYFGAASPGRGFVNVAGNVLLPLVVACVSVAMYV